jgi:hypothetical protein
MIKGITFFMKKTTSYWGVVLVLTFFISILCSCNGSSTNQTEEKLKVKAVEMSSDEQCINDYFSSENPKIIPIEFLKNLEGIDLSGIYWNTSNYPNKKAKKGDIALYLDISPDSKKIDLKYFAYPSIDNEWEGEFIKTSSKNNSNVLLSQTDDLTHQVIQDNDNCIGVNKKVCFLRDDDRIGISFDGVNIAFYKEVDAVKELSYTYLLNKFYPLYRIQEDSTALNPDMERSYIDFDGTRMFELDGRKYCLAFFHNYYWDPYSSREDGDWASQLDLALYQIIHDEKVLIWFEEGANCGTNNYDYGEEVESRTYRILADNIKLQQVGKQFFLTKERTDRIDYPSYTTTLVCYHPINLEEVFRLEFEEYTEESDDTTYSFRKDIHFSESTEESAIIVYDWDLEKNAISPLSITTHIYNVDNNKFMKLN